MRIATYTRISTDETRQPYSLDAQATRLRSYVDSQEDWQLVRQFTDQASGASTERPGLQRALAEARAHRYDLLLVYRVDRFARSVRGLATLLEQLDAAGVAFRSATEPFDTATPAGRMMVQMLGVFAEFERATIIDRVIAGMERKAARGEWCGGSRPHGYLVNPATGHLVANPDEAPLIEIIFDHYARQRHGAKSIATWLNTHGHRTKSGKPWNHMAVLTVLRNRAYLGEIFFRDTYHLAPHQPLVDVETFQLAQQILTQRGEDHAHRASNASDYLLAGLLTCTHCGKKFVGTAAHGNRYRYRYYTCFSRHRYGTTTCPADRLPADQLETAVLAALLHTYRRHDLLNVALNAGHARSGQQRRQRQDELDLVEKELSKAEEAIERYFLAFEAGTMSENTCGQRVQTLGDKIATLHSRRAVLAAELDADQQPTVTEADLQALRHRVEHTITHGVPDAQKGLLQALVADIQVESRNAVRPYFRVQLTGQHPAGLAEPTSDAMVRPPSGSVPPAGFEPAPPPPEGGALSPELRGPGREPRVPAAIWPIRVVVMRTRVLVVDDDAVIRQLVCVNLELEGFEVVTAVDGQDCLDRVKELAPDVITLDVMMPRLDGYQTAERLRADPETRGIKILLLSAKAQERDLRRGSEIGVDAYLTKPFDPDVLIDTVRRLAADPAERAGATDG